MLLSDLRESGSTNQDADCIVCLWRGEYYNITEYEDGIATILFDIVKHHSGTTGEVVTACSMRHRSFQNLS